MNRKIAAILSAAALVATLSACAEDEAPPAPTVTETVTAPAPDPSVSLAPPEVVDDGHGHERVEVPAGPVDGTVQLGELWEYPDGLVVSVTPAGREQASEFAIGAEGSGGSFISFEVAVENGTDSVFDPTMATASATYGSAGLPAEEVFDGEKHGSWFAAPVLPGKTATTYVGFAIPEGEAGDVLVSLDVDWERESALFVGSAE